MNILKTIISAGLGNLANATNITTDASKRIGKFNVIEDVTVKSLSINLEAWTYLMSIADKTTDGYWIVGGEGEETFPCFICNSLYKAGGKDSNSFGSKYRMPLVKLFELSFPGYTADDENHGLSMSDYFDTRYADAFDEYFIVMPNKIYRAVYNS